MNKKNVSFRTGNELKVMINSQDLSKSNLLKSEICIVGGIKNYESLGFIVRSFNNKSKKNLNDNAILEQLLIDKIDMIAANTACTRSEIVRYLLAAACLRQ